MGRPINQDDRPEEIRAAQFVRIIMLEEQVNGMIEAERMREENERNREQLHSVMPNADYMDWH